MTLLKFDGGTLPFRYGILIETPQYISQTGVVLTALSKLHLQSRIFLTLCFANIDRPTENKKTAQ